MAINPFDQFDQPANAFDQFDDQPEAPKPAGAMRKLGDLGLGVAGGVVGITKALADSAGANNKASQVLGSINEGIGDYLSPSAKADQQAISAGMADASAKGFNLEGVKAGVKAFATAPGQFVAQAAGSALPFIAASVATGGTATPAMLGVLAGAGTAKGTIYDRIKKEGGTEEQASKAQEYGGPNTDQIALGGALGVADALTGVASSGTRIIRNALSKPVTQALTNTAERGVLGRAGMGMLKEMPLEAAQGGQEQVAANLAAQRAGYEAGTWDNVASNATLEALASAGPGAAFGALDTQTKQTPPPVVPPAVPPAIDQLSDLPTTAPETPTAPGMGYNPDAGQMTQFPDGSQSFTSEVPPAAPVKPSEAMGINPTAGPISAAAALSVDSGVTQEIQINEANAADQAAYEQATQAQAQQAAEQDTADKPITTGKLAEAQLSEDDKRAILFSNKAVADGGIQYEGTQDGDILNGQGQPYSTRFAAARRARMEGKDWTIATVFDGYVARRKDANVEPDALQPSDTGSLGAGSPDSAPSLVPGPVAADELGAQQSRLAAPDVGQPGELPGGVADAPLNGDFQTEAANVQNPAPAASQPEARVAPDQDTGEAPQDVAGSTAAPAGVPTAGSVAVEGGGVAVASFAKPLQAQAFIGKNKLKDTHQSVKTATGWDVVPKNSQPQESTNAQAPEAIQSESVQEEAPRADLTDAQRAQVNDANAQDFEALYQADIKDGIKRRLGKLKPTEADQKKTPFKSFLREYGIAPTHTSDIAGSNRMRANNVLPATFRANGLGLDALVERAIERGFMTEADRGDQGKLIAMIQSEIAGEQQISSEFAPIVDGKQRVLRPARLSIDAPVAPISKTGTTAAPVNPPASDAEVISRTVERFDRLGVKGVERKKSVIEALASQWGMTSDEVADMPEVQSALRKSPAKASKTAATERFVQGVMQQGLDAVAAERGGANPVQPAAESKPAKIEDSGEVLEGARKLYAKNYAAKLDEGAGMDTAAVPLSKSWPEPDYQRLIDEGADPWAVAMARAMRDEVPTKPSSSWKLKGWVQKVEALRDMTAKVMSGEMTKEKFKTTGGQFNMADWFNKIDLYEAVGHANSLKGLTFGRHEYGMYGGQTFNPAKVLWTINMPSKSASATWSNGNWGNDLAVADTKAEAIEKFKAWSAAQVEAPPVAAKATSFDIYSYRSKPNVFIVGKRISSAKSVDLKEFPTAKEARSYVAANQAELERLLAEAKFEPSERGESNAPRVGADHRNGADVTTEQFRDTFGFRGEQFGASMPQGERQANMNQAYDALMDLAGVVGIPPKALSLNGELGLAFGARGVGGKNPAAAHYERDTTGAVTPNRVVINLTRKNGAGSLAHEWFHAVDNYFARMRGEKAGMLTESYTNRGEGVRPEMVTAFKQLVTTIQLSGMRERSKQLDKKRVKDYWSTGLEMAARSFESYVIAKLQDKNGANDYLANIVPEELYTMQGSYPYPVMGEMPAIRAAFDNFFDVVQTKETEQGVAMFSRGKSGVLSANGKFKGWPKFNTWTRQEYSDVVSLLPEAYRDDAHRVEPIATKDWDTLAATVLPELEALNEVSGAGTFRLDDLGNILVDERKSGRDAVVEDALPIAKKHGLGIFITGVRTESISYYAGAGFVSEMGLGAVLARATGSNAPVVPMASGTVNNPAYGTMMSYKPRGFPMPMFTRGGASTSGLPTTQVSSITSAIRARWGNAPEVIVVANMADPLIPQAVRDYDQAQKSQGATGEPEGFVYKGKVYLVADQLVTPTDVMRVLFHESLGHLGLRGVFGDKLNPILKQLAAMRRGEVAAKAAQYGLDMNTEKGRLEAAEEVLAEMAQTKPELGYVKRAIALIRGWLRTNVPGFNNMKMNDSDIIANFILPARAYIEGKGGKESRGVIVSGARNETKFQSSAGKSWKFDRFAAAGREAGSPQVAMADAVALTGIDLGLAVEISQELGADVPMAFDHASDTVLVNAKFANFPRGEMAQWMAEEILHALDSIRPSRMLSASATSFDLNSGVVATEAMRHFSEGGKLANWLTYPLADDTMTQSQVKAELFARLGVIYFGQPELLKREFPTAYKAYHDTFGLGAIERAQQKDTARDLSAKVFRASGAVDNPQAGIQYGQRAGVAQPGKRSGEARSADPRLERLYSELRRNFGASAGGGLVQFARSNTAPSRAPSQAKTDGANPDIRFSRTVGRNSWDAPEASQFDDLVYKLQDKQIDTKRVVEAIKAKAGALADEKNVYLQEELFHGRAAARTEDFVNKELGPLMNMMKMFSIDIPMLDEYLHARHAEEANKLIAERNPEILDGGSGMTTQAARDYLAKLTKAERNKLETAAAKVDAILASTRQLYADYDLESQDKVDGWGTMFKHYVPLMREDKDGGMGIGQGFSIKGKEVKGRTGSTRKVVDILANIALQRERAIVRGEKNRVATALVGLVKLNPNKDFWQVGPPPAQKVYDPASNSVVERQDPLYKSRDNVVVAKVKGKDGNVTEQAVTFNEDDARAVRMAASLKNLDASQLEGLLGVSAKITRYFAAINTQFNPIFGTVNLVRDVQGALFNLTSTPLKGKALAIAGHTMSALKGIYLDARAARDGKAPASQWAALWEEFQAEGGQTGFRDLFANSADRAKAIERELNPTAWMDSPLGQVFTANGTLKVPLTVAQKKATGMFGWLSDYNLAMENAVRLAAYKVALEQGISKQQSASLGKNLTVNFNRKGQVGQQAGALYAFFNASMQGTARLGQTLFDMEPGKPKTLRLSATGKRIVVGGVLLGSMQAFLLAAAGFDDEEPPDFVRERSLIIPTGGKTYITIPMPLGLHVLPNMGRIPTEFAMGGFKDPVQHIAKMLGLFAGSFNPIGGGASLVQMLAPTAIDPMVAIAENKDWTGKPIAKTSFNKATPGHELTKDTASAPAKLLAEAINYLSGGTEYTAGLLSPTPDQIDYLFGQVTGGVGREASKVLQTGGAIYSGEDLPIHKVPLVGRFYGDTDTQSAQSGKFYSAINKLNVHEAEIKGLRKDGRGDEAAQYLQENPEARLFMAANAAERDVQKMRATKRDLVADGASSEEVKRIEDRISERMMRFNLTMERLREQEAA